MSNTRSIAFYRLPRDTWRAHGLNVAVSSRGHRVLFLLGVKPRNEFLKAMRLKNREHKALGAKGYMTLTRREKLSLAAEL